MKPFFVYLLRCADGTYYVGHTDELERRVAQHRAGEVEGYTHERRPVELVWSQETASRDEALSAERRIKGWGRAKKEALIAGDWERVKELARSRTVRPELIEGVVPTGERLRQAQPERVSQSERNSNSVRPEPVEGPQPEGGGLRQAQPERNSDTARVSTPVRPEPVEGPVPERGGLRQAQPERNSDTARVSPPGCPEPVEGPVPERGGLRQAQPERNSDTARVSTPVRPEPVEEPVPERGGLRQAQPERNSDTARVSTPVRPEPVEGQVPERGGLRQAQPERNSDTARVSPPVRPEPVEGPQPEREGVRQAQPERILAGERRAIAKAITLLESTRADHREQADTLLNTLLPHTGNAMRLGISGVPGVGKSTFIEALGLALIAKGHKVAVLAIDPSSSVSGGSILGDKTRMERLSVHEQAYVRPSPASGTLGGVAEKTREAMLVCEAAGYDVVIVETVGVGQSETAVAGMTDMFVLMQLPNAGDDLQAIKKGVMEIADLVVINKSDLDPAAATRAQAQITSALRVFSFHGNPAHGGERWHTRVVQLSALHGQGVEAFWNQVEQFHTLRRASGEFDARRKSQALSWMWDIVQARLQTDFKQHALVRHALPQTLADVREARLAPSAAARALLKLFESSSS